MASKRCYEIIRISDYLNFKTLHCDSQVINDFFCGSKVSQMHTFLFSELKPAENKHLSYKVTIIIMISSYIYMHLLRLNCRIQEKRNHLKFCCDTDSSIKNV